MQPDDHSARDEQNTASTASIPGPTRRGRAVVDFRPYPTAPTRTRRSPASSGRRAARSGNHPPTPSTIWFTPDPNRAAPDATLVTGSSDEANPGFPLRPGGMADIDPSNAWPLPVLTRAVTSFTEPGATVLLLPWPGAGRDGHGATVPPAAVAAVTDFDRRPRLGSLPAADGRHDADRAHLDGADGRVDLLLTVMPARHDAAEHTDAVARLAARELRLGGVLAVLTHCDRNGGALVDPTGPMATAGQNADLLYLQHVVAVHLPPAHLRNHTTGAADGQAPVAHRRVHSDVLVFAQPHDDDARPAARAPQR
ncbi:hypothetical protein [Pseudonocardia nigra]|uniref:hypothetical protein n=1 Tax=Pseudonocardia nigra TaxID=1921578 RepID=UPI001FE9FCF9|nr:hypothetical protein [Pseudonocardia nigra]